MSTRYLRCAGLIALVAGVLQVGCLVDVENEHKDGDALAESALPIEVLAVNVTDSMNRGIFGKRRDYVYHVGGKYVRHEFSVDTHGHADAYVESIDDNEAHVHGWADAFSGYTFTLKVWIEQ